MPLSQEAIQKILGIEEKVSLTPEEMADKLNITFYPYVSPKTSKEVRDFSEKLKAVFLRLKVNIVPYENALITLPWHKILKRGFKILVNNLLYPDKKVPYEIFSYLKSRKKIKAGIAVVAQGESETGNLPIDHTMSFRESSVITVMDMPPGIDNDTDFHTHFNTAMKLFVHHMTNIVIGVDKEKWVLYNFNASHPIYSLKENFENNVLQALIPKVASPIRPPRFKEFIMQLGAFDPFDEFHKPATEDLKDSGTLFDKSGLYPRGKSIESLPFRNEFYRWIGKIHLDERTGMSYGFLAKQLPAILPELLPTAEAGKIYSQMPVDRDYFLADGQIYIIIKIPEGEFVMPVPEVWVMTQRSGADKTNFRPEKDLIKMGLKGGKMFLQTPKGTSIQAGYRPSFDTKVILAHAVGNAIAAAILKYRSPDHPFVKQLKNSGMSISHWHGYINKNFIPKGWHVHGADRPHVACSSSQSAIYALDGKLRLFFTSLETNEEYLGDIHIEPHHGTNITFPSLRELGEFLTRDKDIAKLGNSYLSNYLF